MLDLPTCSPRAGVWLCSAGMKCSEQRSGAGLSSCPLKHSTSKSDPHFSPGTSVELLLLSGCSLGWALSQLGSEGLLPPHCSHRVFGQASPCAKSPTCTYRAEEQQHRAESTITTKFFQSNCIRAMPYGLAMKLLTAAGLRGKVSVTLSTNSGNTELQKYSVYLAEEI